MKDTQTPHGAATRIALHLKQSCDAQAQVRRIGPKTALVNKLHKALPNSLYESQTWLLQCNRVATTFAKTTKT